MPNDDENVNPLSGSNDLIAKLLSKRKGNEIVEQVHTQLSNADFKRELLGLRRKFGIKVKPDIGDDFIDQYIVNSAFKKQHGVDVEKQGGATDIQAFINTYAPFKKELNAVMAKYKVPQHLERVLKIYLVKDALTAIESVHNLITVQMDTETRDLIIRVDATSRSSSDLKAATPLIYERWDMLRDKPTKYQPAYLAKRDAEIARYKQQGHSHKETATKFGLEIDSVKQIIRRQKAKRQDLK